MLKNKIALVTGSTSGIGLGIARALAREGVHLMLHGLGDPAEIERVRSSLATETGVSVWIENADTRRPEEAARLVATTEREFGALDILVNNAGVQFVSRIEGFPPGGWSEIQDIIISIMLNASFHAIRTAVPGMRQRNRGRIVNLGRFMAWSRRPLRAPALPRSTGSSD